MICRVSPFLFLLFAQLLSHVRTDSTLNKADLSCFECNVIQRSSVKQQRLKPCDGNLSLVVKNCASCAKYVTEMTYDYRKPRFGQDYVTNRVVSKFCLQNESPRFPNQCVSNYGAGSVQLRCFCDTPLCNKASNCRRLKSGIGFVFVISVFLVGKMFW